MLLDPYGKPLSPDWKNFSRKKGAPKEVEFSPSAITAAEYVTGGAGRALRLARPDRPSKWRPPQTPESNRVRRPAA